MSVIETLQERKTKTPSESKVEWFKAVQKGDPRESHTLFV